MLVVVKVKDTDEIIGLKEDIAARLEDVTDIERIDIYEEGEEEEHGKAERCEKAREIHS